MYDTQNGLPSITPSQTIKENPYGGLDIYENKNGIPSITPTAVIKKKDE